MPEAEAKYLLQNVDLLAKQDPTRAMYTLQRMMRKSSGNIARIQALIAVEKIHQIRRGDRLAGHIY